MIKIVSALHIMHYTWISNPIVNSLCSMSLWSVRLLSAGTFTRA